MIDEPYEDLAWEVELLESQIEMEFGSSDSADYGTRPTRDRVQALIDELDAHRKAIVAIQTVCCSIERATT